MDITRLPNGEHWGLNIDSDHLQSSGPMIGARPKLVLHTTEGSGFGTMDRVLREKSAEPHVLIDPGTREVKQYFPFNQYSKALEHPYGTPETNRANCIQIEIVGFAAPNPSHRDVAEESLDWYANLGALCELIRHRVPFLRVAPYLFVKGVQRIPVSTFAGVGGIIGHMHVPSQPSGHWDPGRFNARSLIHCMEMADTHYS